MMKIPNLKLYLKIGWINISVHCGHFSEMWTVVEIFQGHNIKLILSIQLVSYMTQTSENWMLNFVFSSQWGGREGTEIMSIIFSLHFLCSLFLLHEFILQWYLYFQGFSTNSFVLYFINLSCNDIVSSFFSYLSLTIWLS